MHEFFVAINAQLVRNGGNALMKDDQSELHSLGKTGHTWETIMS